MPLHLFPVSIRILNVFVFPCSTDFKAVLCNKMPVCPKSNLFHQITMWLLRIIFRYHCRYGPDLSSLTFSSANFCLTGLRAVLCQTCLLAIALMHYKLILWVLHSSIFSRHPINSFWAIVIPLGVQSFIWYMADLLWWYGPSTWCLGNGGSLP